jgi:ectoine hydroxylase-related dioxygenase (phytanoyl-CoA dioxygenase family)
VVTSAAPPLTRAEASVATVAQLLDAQGFAVVSGMLSHDAVEAAAADMRRILSATPTGRNPFEGARTRRVYALFAKTRVFDGPVLDPLVLGVMDRYLEHYHLSAPTGIEIQPGEVAQILHYDDAIYPVARPHAELVVNTMWALDDFTEANGATRIIPGSHRWVDRQPDIDSPTAAATMPRGSVLFYLGSVWHGGGANRTDRPRLGVILEYAASWVRPQETHLLAVPPETVRQLPERLRELLGYNIRPPFIGYVDGRHPLRTLEDGGR